MIASSRYDQILELLQEQRRLTVEAASERLGLGVQTVRRAFSLLAEKSLVRRVRGGVELAPLPIGEMTAFSVRHVQNIEKKRAIARTAASLLQAGNVVVVDGGTTTLQLASCLPDQPLHVITNSLRLGAALDLLQMERKGLEVSLTGGFLYPNSGLLLGPGAENSLGEFRSDWAFLSGSGIAEQGLFNTNQLVLASERIIIENADKVAVLADHSKIGKPAMCRICDLNMIDVLITDSRSDGTPELDRIRQAGVQVIVAAPLPSETITAASMKETSP